MGIQVEYNPDLALRHITEVKKGNREETECLPVNMKVGNIYDFLKRGQRLYWLHGEIPLLETVGHEKLSSPIASIIIIECTHFLIDDDIWTKGKYKIVEIFKDKEIHFNGFARIPKIESSLSKKLFKWFNGLKD
ncbi:MAG: hypothetical protein QG609_485 [Patescibacteria group bacterium]|nr:hypothetical protein [Patescibacteria group bacterium]